MNEKDFDEDGLIEIEDDDCEGHLGEVGFRGGVTTSPTRPLPSPSPPKKELEGEKSTEGLKIEDMKIEDYIGDMKKLCMKCLLTNCVCILVELEKKLKTNRITSMKTAAGDTEQP